MKCTNCGFENEQSYTVCPQCQTEVRPNPAAQAILGALRDPLFLVICILLSVATALSLVGGNLPVIEILFTVFLWLVYSKSSKGIADAKYLRCVSGTMYANYVITYVAAILVAVMGLILAAALKMIVNDPFMLEELLSELGDVDYAAISGMITFLPGSLLLVAFLIAAAAVVVLNIFSNRYIHRFAKSVYQSIETGNLNLKHATVAMVWLFIYGGISGLSCLSSLANGLLAALGSAASCGACIIAGLLINKYLSDLPTEPAIPQQIAE